MLDVIWDMETGDPDDFLTLLLLLGHPRVNLVAVTITPGTPDQVGVVRTALSWFGRSIPVGAFDLEHRTKGGSCVSAWHYRAYGDMPASRDAVPGPALLRARCGPTTTLVTGAPLKNLGAALAMPGFQLGRVVVQGGFAGEGVVPPERQLAKFRGRVTCPTYNLDGDPKSARAVIASTAIAAKRFVSKNVCHGVSYDAELHERVGASKASSRSLELIWRGIDAYLPARPSRTIAGREVRLLGANKQLELLSRDAALARAAAAGLALVPLNDDPVPVCRLEPPDSRADDGKKLHDPLAACCAIDESIGEWAEVELFRERGEWGSRLSPGSGVHIITGYDRAKFIATFTEL